MSGDINVEIVVDASTKAVKLIGAEPAAFNPVGVPAAEKNVDVANAFAWNVTELDVAVNPVGTINFTPVPEIIPPVDVAILPATTAEIVDEPVQPVVLNVWSELVALSPAIFWLTTS